MATLDRTDGSAGMLARAKSALTNCAAGTYGRARAGRFALSQRGSINIMTALLAIPMVLTVGAAVDTGELYRAKRNFQQAADAAVLVAANMYSDGAGKAAAEEAGERIFADNLANLPDSSGVPKFKFPVDCGKGDIILTVTGQHPLFFSAFHGFGKGENGQGAAIHTTAGASCPTTTFEVALVVDTSGSMGWTIPGDADTRPKIEILQEAAKGLVTDLFAVGKTVPREDPVQFSVIPFSGMVAVDYENKTADATRAAEKWDREFEDLQGKSSIHHKDFHVPGIVDEHPDFVGWSWDTPRKPQEKDGGWKVKGKNEWLTRYTLYDDLDVKWRGCMQQRPYPHSVQDTAPASSDPETLFVPAFAPDEPDRLNGEDSLNTDDSSYPYCTKWKKNKKKCSKWSDGKKGATNNDGNPTTPTYNDGTYYKQGVYQLYSGVKDSGYDISGELRFRNSYIADGQSMPSDNVCKGYPNHNLCSGKRDQPLRQAFTSKYRNASWWNDKDSVDGPNYGCYAEPLLPLSRNEKSVKDYLAKLKARGSTNVPAGAAWGWRTLSSNLPFVGRPEKKLDNRKIMILMTDGQNTYYRAKSNNDYSDYNQTFYGGYGYGRHDDGVNDPSAGDGFMFDGFSKYGVPGQNANTWTEAMDTHLAKICENAKKDNITIYSIAFDVDDGSSIKDTLEGCASTNATGSETYYFDASDAAQLKKTFEEIAKSLKRLRLVQ